MSKDPILFNGGSNNLYSYSINDPVNLVDPSGLWYAGVAFGGSASVGYGVGMASYDYGSYAGYSSSTGATFTQYANGMAGGGVMVGGGAGGSASLNLGWGDDPTGKSYGISVSIPVLGTFTGTIGSSGISLGYSNGAGWQAGIAGVVSNTGLGSNANEQARCK